MVERFDLQLEAFVSSPGSASQNESESLVTRDISMCGAFLKTDTPLPVGSKVCVDMILTLGGQKEQNAQKDWIKASGKVLRTDFKKNGLKSNRPVAPFRSLAATASSGKRVQGPTGKPI